MANYDDPAIFWDSPGLTWDSPAVPPPKPKKKMALIKLELQDLSVLQKISLANNIVTAMTGNVNYTTPDPALATVTTKATALETAHGAAEVARQASKTATAAMEDAERDLDNTLTTLAGYVQKTSEGNEAKILSAGMGVRSGPTTAVLVAPAHLVATFGDNSGEIDLSWDNQKGARSWIVDCCEHTGGTVGPWQQAKVATKSKTTVEDLTPGKTYAFRVRAVGNDDELGPWSDETVKMAP